MKAAKKACKQKNCSAKARDYHCNPECNTLACDFDGGDCSLGINPWRNCTVPGCWRNFADGKCDMSCNTAECLFDGRDCEKVLKPCNPVDNKFCERHYGDGFCDEGCNNEECNWDGMDCESKPPVLASGIMSIVLKSHTVQEILNKKSSFLRYLGHQLRTTVRIKQSDLGVPMVYAWDPSVNPASVLFNGSDAFQHSESATGVLIYLEIDNRKCSSSNQSCFMNTYEAAEFLAGAAARQSLPSDFDIFEVRGLDNSLPNGSGNASWVAYVLLGALSVIMVALIFGVLFSTQRKKSRGITWFPDGFLRNAPVSGHRRSRRRGPDGQEMRNLSKGHPLDFDMDSGNSAMAGYDGIITDVTSQCSDDSDRPPSKRMRSDGGYASDHTLYTDYDEIDPRPWTHQHLEAADIRHPDILALTPPDNQRSGFEVDVRGPCGLTPLMVASLRGGGLDAGDEEDDDGTAAVIADLVAQGAKLNATMDKTGETSLHLAARYARADAAKRLLDAGADANAKDHTGRTPLHAAIAADAMGVFQVYTKNVICIVKNFWLNVGKFIKYILLQILLRNRATNLNARMHDGTTPLILSARLAIEGMVENLINAQADINAADNNGKTSLHWAAAVNNVEAVQILLNHGANRDAQNERVSVIYIPERIFCIFVGTRIKLLFFGYSQDETPLFLAAREGSFASCKLLLDNMANRDIADHMDRLPRDVASDRLHHDIVRLLDEHVARPSAMQNMHQNSNQNANSNSNGASSTNGASHPNAQTSFASGLSQTDQAPLAPMQPKPKKRNSKPDNGKQGEEGNQNGNVAPCKPRRPTVAARRKKSADSLLTGVVNHGMMDNSPLSSESMSPPDHHHMMYNGNMPQSMMAISQPNLSSMGESHHLHHHQQSQQHHGGTNHGSSNNANGFGTLQITKAPPPYEECLKSAVSFHSLHFSNYSNGLNGGGNNGNEGNANNALNGSHHQQQSQSNNGSGQQQLYMSQNSPFPSPQSVPSHFTPSPTTKTYVGSPPSQPAATSPNKRPSLPTSPTHMAALRAATQQKMMNPTSFDYSQAVGATGGSTNGATGGQYFNGTMSHYPTPPSQHSENSPHSAPDSYPTPSPESPGQWSSSSPHSTSDWSEGISSPPASNQVVYNSNHAQLMMNPQMNHNSRGAEGIYI